MKPTNGYDQFFNSAKKVARKKSQPLVQKRKKRPFPYAAFVLFVVCLATFAWIAFYPDQVDQVFQKVEVRFMSAASAADDKSAENSAAPNDPKQATSAKGDKDKDDPKLLEIGDSKTEDLSYLSKLNDRKKELDLREKELSELEEELHRQRDEVEARIKKLEEIRSQIASILKDKVQIDQSKVDKLVEFYSNMKPKQAADILASVNEDLAVEILGKMKKKNAAEIMNLLPAAKAQVISEKFAGYKRR